MPQPTKPYCYQYPRPALGIDCLILRRQPGGLELLTIMRGNEPFKGMPSLPGGFFDMEDAEIKQTAHRELKEETGIESELHLLGPYSAKDRDPRERTVSIAWYGEVAPDTEAIAGDDAASVHWLPVHNLPAMAFDHNRMVADLLARLGE